MTGTFLEIHNGEQNQRIAFNKDKFGLGRGPTNDIVLVDDLSSRNHALIERVSGKYYLRDLKSRNGTKYNGKKIAEVVELHNGDKVQIGRYTVTLVIGETAQVESLDVLTADDLVEVEPDASDDVLPADLLAGDDSGDANNPDQSAAAQMARLASHLPSHGVELDKFEMTDSRGQTVHKKNKKSPSAPGEPVELLRLLLMVSFRARATDVHIEPRQDGHYIRLRIDGMMVDIVHVPTAVGTRISTVVKVLSEIDIAQRNTIQEGSFAARIPDEKNPGKFRRMDYRVSFAPAVLGQKLVVRILDSGGAPARLSDLGLPQAMMEQVAKVIHRDAGMVLVAGPTGSGKTTTLYALLRSIDLAKRNVVTIEDPVEVHLDGITQIPVDDSQDRSFIQLLRSVLRQDPDVILVGEIRDAETARVAMQSAITGHMVFSTVHTRDTLGTIFRLRDLGVEPYMLTQGLQLVISQRLIRQLCPFCKKAVPPTGEQVAALGPSHAGVKKLYKPVGCERCLRTGHAGRRAYFELLANSEAVTEAILSNASRQDILKLLAAAHFVSLRDSAYQLVADGFVAFDEVDRDMGAQS
jgi:type II secretory ATPase GspE/PulE/Tfp pilus assembly ATPase PilB-like protein